MSRCTSCLLAIATLIVTMSALVPIATAAPARSASYVVVLRPGASVSGELAQHGLVATAVYSSVFTGYAAALTEAQRRAVAADANTQLVAIDDVVSSWQGKKPPVTPPPPPTAQVIPTGVARIGGLDSATADIDGVDERVNVDIAVLDSGIDTGHPDLNIAGGVNCVGGKGTDDPAGHGTHVAGIAAALDNSIGTVGVAPGARLWAVRVLDKNGFGNNSRILCGLDWITANAGVIDVANLSFGEAGSDDGNCGITNKDVMHQAICRTIAAGVTVVASAGNSPADVAATVPAAYSEVITVSAITDYNGAAGGGAASNCFSTDPDDSLASYSGRGAGIDIAAPGTCIFSTWVDGLYSQLSGTSMSAPHVAGAAGLYKATHPLASPAQVANALKARASAGALTGDTDGFNEGVLDVSTL